MLDLRSSVQLDSQGVYCPVPNRSVERRRNRLGLRSEADTTGDTRVISSYLHNREGSLSVCGPRTAQPAPNRCADLANPKPSIRAERHWPLIRADESMGVRGHRVGARSPVPCPNYSRGHCARPAETRREGGKKSRLDLSIQLQYLASACVVGWTGPHRPTPRPSHPHTIGSAARRANRSRRWAMRPARRFLDRRSGPCPSRADFSASDRSLKSRRGCAAIRERHLLVRIERLAADCDPRRLRARTRWR